MCGVIKKWEDDIAENKKKEVEKESDQKKENLNDNGNGIEKRNVDDMKKEEKETLQGNTAKENEEIASEVKKDKISKSIGESDKEVEAELEVEERGFGSYWPFLCSQRECDRASDYLSAINNSHIITQLISNLKILQLAEERGLQISDRDLIAEIGNVEIPLIGKHEDDLHYSDDDDDDENDDDGYDDDRYYSDEYSDYDERGEDEDGNDDDIHNNSGGNKNGDRNSDRGSDKGSDRGSGPVNESAEAGESGFVQGNQVDLKEQERDREEKGKGDKEEVQKGNKEKEKKEAEVKEMEEENLYSDEDEDEDDDNDRDSDWSRHRNKLRSKKRKSRRRTANNKKRRMKKKTRCADADNKEGRESREEVVEEEREEVEGAGMVGTRVTFNIDSRHQVHNPLLDQSPSQSQSQIIPIEKHDIKIIDDFDENNGIKSNTAILSSCPPIKSQHTALGESMSEDLNGHTPLIDPAARTYIRDIVSTDEKKKSIRVHEYYKLWRIYDLDVVY